MHFLCPQVITLYESSTIKVLIIHISESLYLPSIASLLGTGFGQYSIQGFLLRDVFFCKKINNLAKKLKKYFRHSNTQTLMKRL